MHFIIGTAGHVDHGKTTLIRALTGIETDRLREEKERGLSIVPGFAHISLPPFENSPARVAGIVDVPGHERFLKNMLSGISGVDVAMLVIAADEGVMPQTMEHLRILELLQMRRGVIVLTKCDAVDNEWRALARDDVRQKLAATRFADAPLCEVSAQNGHGLDELKKVLARLCAELEAAPPRSAPFRLPVDRAFSISGFGTVVTGSVADGAVSVGETLDIWQPGQDTPLVARVRGLEVHGQSAQSAQRGQRAAVNLAGVDLDETLRGGTLAASGTLRGVTLLETWLSVVPDAPRALKDKAPVRFHLGTAETEARLHLYDATRLLPGESGFVRIVLSSPVACARGDRFVLREVGTERVAGGGIILDLPAEKLPRAQAKPWLELLREAIEIGDDAALLQILLRRAGVAGLSEAQARLELRRDDLAPLLSDQTIWRASNAGEEWLFHGEAFAALRAALLQTLGDFHKREPLAPAMPHEALRVALPAAFPGGAFEALLLTLQNEKIIAVEASGVRLSSHRVTLSEDEERLKNKLEKTAYDAAWQPLTIDELLAAAEPNPKARDAARKLCFALIKQGRLVRVDDFVLSRRRADEGAALLENHLRQSGTLTVAQARELLNSTRKWIVPLLEYYDRIGLTRRNGDTRTLR